MRLYGTFQKIDAERRMVFGYASTEAIDAHGEIVLKSAIEDALADYLEFANLREMHQLSAVGTTEEAEVDDKGLYIGAKVTDDTAWGKVTSKTYKGFSIGGKVLARDPDNKKIVTKILLTEISLVDRPSNPETKFDVWKAAGAPDQPKSAHALLDQIDAALAGTNLNLSKSLYHVGRFAELLESIGWLAASAEAEAELEADDSPVPKELRDWIKAGAAIFEHMAKEEVDELVAAGKIKKAAAAAGLAKVTGRDASDAIMKVIHAKDAEIGRLSKRIEDLLNEPAPAKCAGAHAFFAISKEDDASGGPTLQKATPDTSDVAAALAAMPPEERALLLTKAALAMPRPATMVPVNQG